MCLPPRAQVLLEFHAHGKIPLLATHRAVMTYPCPSIKHSINYSWTAGEAGWPLFPPEKAAPPDLKAKAARLQAEPPVVAALAAPPPKVEAAGASNVVSGATGLPWKAPPTASASELPVKQVAPAPPPRTAVLARTGTA